MPERLPDRTDAPPPPFDVLDFFRNKDGSVRVDVNLLWEPFRYRLFLVLERCHKRGHDYFATSGTRWWSEQEKLHKKHLAGGPRAAPPGFSAHQFGVAVDLAPDADESKPGLQGPDYRDVAYDVLVEETKRIGLVSGRGFNDNPHVQIPTFVSGRSMQPLRKLWSAVPGTDRDKLSAVFRYFDMHAELPAVPELG